MKTLIVLILATLLSTYATSQERRRIIVSPRVGAEIDSGEAGTFRLFRTVIDFHSASFFREPDNTFSAVVQRKSRSGLMTDSVFVISLSTLQVYAERIDNWEELKEGTYIMGSTQPQILIEEDTAMNPDQAASGKRGIPLRKIAGNSLPLVPNTSGQSRPIFQTIRFELALGFFLNHFSELQQLIGDISNVSVPMSAYIHIPIVDEPSFSFLGGWGVALGGSGGGSLFTFSAVLLFRTSTLSHHFNPIIGVGYGRSIYSYTEEHRYNIVVGPYRSGLLIDASVSYPVIVLGTSIIRNSLDVCLVFPFVKTMKTTFEGKSYSIRPAGSGLNLLLSL